MSGVGNLLPTRTRKVILNFLFLILLGLLIVPLSPNLVDATPYLPAEIYTSATITGSFSYNINEHPLDTDPSGSGYYAFTGASNQITMTVGGSVFSSQTTSPILNVVVGNYNSPTDGIKINASADQTSFSPYLNNFTRQGSGLVPYGNLLIWFHFPGTYLNSDALPTTIDPLATVGPVPGSSFPNIYGQIEGISTHSSEKGTTGIREWAFFFSADPLNMNISVVDGILTGTFTGSITGVDDRAQFNAQPVPIPGALVLFGSGLLGLVGIGKKRFKK